MSGISRAADLYYTFRFLKLLVTKWTDMEAYKLGVIDDTGKSIIKARNLTSEQKPHYTTFHRLVFNIKRLMEKVPFGKSRIASYAAALYLLKEETGMSETAIISALEELNVDISGDIVEATITPGQYILSDDITVDFPKGYVITVEDRVASFAGIDIYGTKENILVTTANIS
jgi:hypothetical protein